MHQIRPSSLLFAVLRLLAAVGVGLVVATGLGLALPARAQALDAGLASQVQQLAEAGALNGMPAQARVEVQLGRLDPRLKLAPCRQVQPYLPTGLSMWGRTRIGLRCLDGQHGGQGAAAGLARWNVSLPVTVKVYGRALVASGPLPAGTVLTQEHLSVAEIDIAAEPAAGFTDAAALVGRTLTRPLAAGDALRSSSLNRRQWFAAGETVMVRVAGPGYAIAGEGQALTAGLDGQDVKIRFDNGRTVSGRATGERLVELLL
ncbi:flagellar basal body P-ring formation chaperone FlgA [Roseateles violae]|uniref:Flagellar basal body P-ring formation chaperone FlgA n=1 Tax=Roseateles violae TaxID=3058042 RepID=A0ABT8DTW4_9BURK|nr:flagellar basal body P-ring formation chaperone FlgA [Pelomonas sp. PFR6]MDN3919817.1 flagellar basal body P-ring formation chaperone FlgA [Pelomonas sp. PFR6]